MSKIIKVTIEYDDKIFTLKGKEAVKWEKHNISVATLAHVHGINPFENDPVTWMIKKKKS